MNEMIKSKIMEKKTVKSSENKTKMVDNFTSDNYSQTI